MNYIAIYKVDKERNKKPISALNPTWETKRRASHYYRTDLSVGESLGEAIILTGKPSSEGSQKLNFYREWKESPLVPGDVVAVTGERTMKTRYFMLLPNEWEEGVCKEVLDGKTHDLEYVGNPN
jgi:hypothetical protein